MSRFPSHSNPPQNTIFPHATFGFDTNRGDPLPSPPPPSWGGVSGPPTHPPSSHPTLHTTDSIEVSQPFFLWLMRSLCFSSVTHQTVSVFWRWDLVSKEKYRGPSLRGMNAHAEVTTWSITIPQSLVGTVHTVKKGPTQKGQQMAKHITTEQN